MPTRPRPRIRQFSAPGKPAPTMAQRADRHELYQLSVQSVDAEIDFVDSTYRRIRGRRASLLREDFCGTANSSCEWVRRRPGNIAFGVDLHQPTLDWGLQHNIARLRPGARSRVRLMNADVTRVVTPRPVDIVLAMNFSYYCFKDRATLRRYFRHVRKGLKPGGLFFIDAYGGSDAFREMRERRPIKPGPRGIGPFTYIWDQAKFDPITANGLCHIHFQFRDGSKLKDAFTYDWRIWTLPELTELLAEAGFRNPTVYWEGTDENNEGNGVFTAARHGEADLSFISYIVSER